MHFTLMVSVLMLSICDTKNKNQSINHSVDLFKVYSNTDPRAKCDYIPRDSIYLNHRVFFIEKVFFFKKTCHKPENL